ncbi:hypothetical protein GCM10009718_09440 [Isoptericola halotolerans]
MPSPSGEEYTDRVSAEGASAARQPTTATTAAGREPVKARAMSHASRGTCLIRVGDGRRRYGSVFTRPILADRA